MRGYRKSIWLTLLLLAVLSMSGCDLLGSTSITVEWTTASEVDHAGFNLYRSESPGGPWVQINQNLIPPSGDPIVGGSYSYVDDTVEVGHTYYYQLEDVALNGSTTRHPPIEVTADLVGDWTNLVWGATMGIVLAAGLLTVWQLWSRLWRTPKEGSS